MQTHTIEFKKAGVPDESWSSHETWGLILTDLYIGVPEVQKVYVDIPGRSGSLDMSEAIAGEPAYLDRTLEFTFSYQGEDKESVLDEVLNAISGESCEIRVPGVIGFFTGRIQIDIIHNLPYYVELKVTATCNPYRTDEEDTVITETIESSGTILCPVAGRTIRPEIKVSAPTQITYMEITQSFTPTDDYQHAKFTMPKGQNVLTIEGTGTVSVKWRGGRI